MAHHTLRQTKIKIERREVECAASHLHEFEVGDAQRAVPGGNHQRVRLFLRYQVPGYRRVETDFHVQFAQLRRQVVGEEVVIGPDVRLTVVSVRGGTVRLGIVAPPTVRVDRKEVRDRASELVAGTPHRAGRA